MALADDQPERPRWRWPQFTVRDLLVVTTIFAALWGFLAMRAPRDELPGAIASSFVLLWGLLCWRTVRLNSHFFQSRKRMAVDSTGRPLIPPPSLRDAWFIVFPVLVVAFYTSFFIYCELRGAYFFSTLLPVGDPGHISWAENWWVPAGILAVGILWYSTAAWVCVMVSRHPLIRYKVAWQALAIVLSPIVCPIVYFTRLRPRKIAGNEPPRERSLGP